MRSHHLTVIILSLTWILPLTHLPIHHLLILRLQVWNRILLRSHTALLKARHIRIVLLENASTLVNLAVIKPRHWRRLIKVL